MIFFIIRILMSEIYNLSRRKFAYNFGCLCGASLVLPSCTEVAISDRRQFNIYSDKYLYSQTFSAFKRFKTESKLITGTSDYTKLLKIGYNIRDAINAFYLHNNQKNPTDNFEWEFILINDDNIKNAWCMPGGKIAFYSGILSVAKNEDGIASIMGHEIAHAVARHSAERASTAMLADFGTIALETFVLGKSLPGGKYIRQFGLDLPFNRSQETEADYLGLVFMSLAGYDVEESYKIWERMKESNSNNPAEFFSTHPSPDNRIRNLQKWIPIVSNKYPAIG